MVGRHRWTSCEAPYDKDDQLQCGKFSVPLDWDRPDGTHIDLAVARRLAGKPAERIGSMLVNPGGPGQSGVDLALGSGDDFDAWGGGRFDVVGWDPRGTNRSSPVKCFTSDAESQAYQRRTVELARRCGQVSGELLDHISTADTARDLDELRQPSGTASSPIPACPTGR